MAADLGVYGLSYSVWGRTADLHTYVAAIPRPPQFAGERVAAPDAPSKLRTGDRMLLAGIQRVDGYAGLEPAKQLDYADPGVLAMAGVAWQLERTGDGSAYAERMETHYADGAQGAADYSCVAGERTAASAEPPLARSRVRTVADRCRTRNPARCASSVIGRAEMEIEVAVPAQQLLVTTESFDSGWTASADGQSVPVVRVNGDFLGCAIEPGKHLVRLEFRPRARRVGGWLAMLGLGFLTVAVGLAATNACRIQRPEV